MPLEMKNPPSALVMAVISLVLHSVVNFGGGVFGQGTDHYCSTDSANPIVEISGEAEGGIYTLYPGDAHYKNNQNCVWMIDAGAGNRVEISVVSSDLQWAHPSVICPGHDHVAIKDGQDGGEESILLPWCGHAQPLGAVSSGHQVRVEFMSDKNNPYQYSGVHLRFQTFSSSDCAPSWNNSMGFCYKLMDKETDWSSAQKECNTGSANLVSVLTADEHEFLLSSFGLSTSTAWIGLNDIVYEGDYKWIDGKQYNFNRFGPNHAPNQYYRCVEMGFRPDDWRLKDCEKDKSKPLCKSHRGSKTPIFPIPQRRADETKPETPVGRLAAIIISVIALVIIIVVAVIVYRRFKSKQRRQNTYSSPKPTVAESQNIRTESFHEPERGTRQPSAPPEEHVDAPVMINPDSRMLAPPAYEEALSHPVLSSPVHV